MHLRRSPEDGHTIHHRRLVEVSHARRLGRREQRSTVVNHGALVGGDGVRASRQCLSQEGRRGLARRIIHIDGLDEDTQTRWGAADDR